MSIEHLKFHVKTLTKESKPLHSMITSSKRMSPPAFDSYLWTNQGLFRSATYTFELQNTEFVSSMLLSLLNAITLALDIVHRIDFSESLK